jgi:predicted alpha/beta hydrolase family esterase
MSPSAKVTSVEAIDAFKASLIVYLEKAGGVLDDISDDVVRTRTWLQTDRQLHWKNQVRQRARALGQAEQELLTARLSGMPEAIKARRMAVNKAQLELREAEDGLARVKQWIGQYDARVESRAKVVAQLRHSLAHDMRKAVAFLEKAGATLAGYAEIAPPASSAPAAPADAAAMAESQERSADQPVPEGDNP